MTAAQKTPSDATSHDVDHDLHGEFQGDFRKSGSQPGQFSEHRREPGFSNWEDRRPDQARSGQSSQQASRQENDRPGDHLDLARMSVAEIAAELARKSRSGRQTDSEASDVARQPFSALSQAAETRSGEVKAGIGKSGDYDMRQKLKAQYAEARYRQDEEQERARKSSFDDLRSLLKPRGAVSPSVSENQSSKIEPQVAAEPSFSQMETASPNESVETSILRLDDDAPSVPETIDELAQSTIPVPQFNRRATDRQQPSQPQAPSPADQSIAQRAVPQHDRFGAQFTMTPLTVDDHAAVQRQSPRDLSATFDSSISERIAAEKRQTDLRSPDLRHDLRAQDLRELRADVTRRRSFVDAQDDLWGAPPRRVTLERVLTVCLMLAVLGTGVTYVYSPDFRQQFNDVSGNLGREVSQKVNDVADLLDTPKKSAPAPVASSQQSNKQPLVQPMTQSSTASKPSANEKPAVMMTPLSSDSDQKLGAPSTAEVVTRDPQISTVKQAPEPAKQSATLSEPPQISASQPVISSPATAPTPPKPSDQDISAAANMTTSAGGASAVKSAATAATPSASELDKLVSQTVKKAGTPLMHDALSAPPSAATVSSHKNWSLKPSPTWMQAQPYDPNNNGANPNSSAANESDPSIVPDVDIVPDPDSPDAYLKPKPYTEPGVLTPPK